MINVVVQAHSASGTRNRPTVSVTCVVSYQNERENQFTQHVHGASRQCLVSTYILLVSLVSLIVSYLYFVLFITCVSIVIIIYTLYIGSS